MKAYSLFVYALCLVILAVFLFYRHLNDSQFTAKYYFISMKVMEFFLVLGYAVFNKGKERKCGIAVATFFFIRIVWQLFEPYFYGVANSSYVLDTLFILLLLVMLIIFFTFRKSI